MVVTPFVLESSSGGQLWNINVSTDSIGSGNLEFKANSSVGGPTWLEINDDTGHVAIGKDTSIGARLDVAPGRGLGISTTGNTAVGIVGQADTTGIMASSIEGGIGLAATVNGIGPGGGSGLAAFFGGDVRIRGELFIDSPLLLTIDNPIDPANSTIKHAAITSSEILNIYSGIIILDNNGQGIVKLPTWVEALNHDFRYQLTCLGGYAPVYISKEVENNTFRIAGGNSNMRISWQLSGVRKDPVALQNPLVVDQPKPNNERGYYHHPEAYGYSWDKSCLMAQYRKSIQSMIEYGALENIS